MKGIYNALVSLLFLLCLLISNCRSKTKVCATNESSAPIQPNRFWIEDCLIRNLNKRMQAVFVISCVNLNKAHLNALSILSLRPLQRQKGLNCWRPTALLSFSVCSELFRR